MKIEAYNFLNLESSYKYMDLKPIYILFQSMKMITMFNTWLTERAAMALDPNAFCHPQMKAG